MPIVLALGIGLAIGWFLPGLLGRHRADEITLQARQSADRTLAEANAGAEGILADARAKADAANAETARIREAAAIERLAAQHRLHDKFPGLIPIVDRRTVNGRRLYVRGLEIDASGAGLTIIYENDRDATISPDVTIYLLTESGIVTDTIDDRWLVDTVAKGEVRREHKSMRLRFGEPVYAEIWPR
jgi:hypothetical protein